MLHIHRSSGKRVVWDKSIPVYDEMRLFPSIDRRSVRKHLLLRHILKATDTIIRVAEVEQKPTDFLIIGRF